MILHLLDAVPTLLLTALDLAADETPEPEDVKAGWTGFAVLIGLIVAVVLLLVSMTRHMRRVRRNAQDDADAEAAARGDVPTDATD